MQMMPKWIHRQGRLALLSPVAFGLLTMSKSDKGLTLCILYACFYCFALSFIRHLLFCIGLLKRKKQATRQTNPNKKGQCHAHIIGERIAYLMRCLAIPRACGHGVTYSVTKRGWPLLIFGPAEVARGQLCRHDIRIPLQIFLPKLKVGRGTHIKFSLGLTPVRQRPTKRPKVANLLHEWRLRVAYLVLHLVHPWSSYYQRYFPSLAYMSRLLHGCSETPCYT